MSGENRTAELFAARVLELASRAGRGVLSVSEFLSPGEARAASAVLDAGGYRGCYGFYGGYDGAERKRLFCLPDHMLGYGDADLAAKDAAVGDVSVLRVTGSGYRELRHRDFLGSILALGIKRGVLGDIIVDEDAHGAYVFCDGKICVFLTENLDKVASDTVRAETASLPENFFVCRKTEPITDTVASPRADSVVASLLRVSRERAKERISAGLVEVNYETLTKPDEKLGAGDIVSVRGSGKYRITELGEVTRRGRLRLLAEKYI